MNWASETYLSTVALLNDFAPIVGWEREWQLQLPRQDAFDREGLLNFEPMNNAYTFSFKPKNPNSFTLTLDLPSNALEFDVQWAVQLDPNEAVEMKKPYAGVFAGRRRQTFTATAVLITLQYLTVACTSNKRVYIRLAWSATNTLSHPAGTRVTWEQLRLVGFFLQVPGYHPVVGPASLPDPATTFDVSAPRVAKRAAVLAAIAERQADEDQKEEE
jgi:hypothetical protein